MQTSSSLSTSLAAVAVVCWLAVGCGEGSTDSGGDAGETDDATTTADTGAGQGSDSGDNADANAACDSDHRKVGWTATLEGKGNYDVSGTAKIVDNCTVAIENFTYNGDGVVVKIYGTGQTKSGSDAPDFTKGFAMSEDLKGTSFDGERFVAKLPENKSLDELIALSVWCVDADVDFGSGRFTQ